MAEGGSTAERDLIRLVFASTAAPGLTEADLEAIAARSTRNNRAAGLTGLLLHQDDGFFGFLEGPRRRLFARMERIITDPRHARVDILLEAPADHRRFDTWSFGRLAAGSFARNPAVADFVRDLTCRLK